MLSGIALAIGCSSAPRDDDPGRPEWTRQPARTVDQGYIVYVASDEDTSPERARFKAEAQAIEDMANECSLVPKGARIEDHYDHAIKRLHQAFVKVAVDFQSCEEARAVLQPGDIQKLANVAMTEEMKRYQDEVEKPVLAQGPETDEEQAMNEAVSDNTNPMLRQTAPPPVMVISTGPQFFIVRQQIAYAKEVVILSPPQAYPPGAPQTRAFETNLRPLATNVATYEKANPQIRTSVASWSGYRRQLQQARQRRRRGARPNRGSQNGSRGEGGNGKRRKRWNGSPGGEERER